MYQDWNNLPEDLEAAIERIMTLEAALDDLVRAVEIGSTMSNFDYTRSFAERGSELVANKIVPVFDDSGEPVKILVVTDDTKEETEKDEDAA